MMRLQALKLLEPAALHIRIRALCGRWKAGNGTGQGLAAKLTASKGQRPGLSSDSCHQGSASVETGVVRVKAPQTLWFLRFTFLP
jgi:hypothetical protein